MKHENGGVAFEKCVGLTPEIYSFLVEDNSEHWKEKGVKRNVVATIGHNEYKDVLLIEKRLRYSVNRIQSKDHRTHRYLWNHQNFVVLLWWQSIYLKQWIWRISSWLLELTIKNSYLNNFFC